ncbi:MAG: hypothetical protein GX603_00975 [Chloroflexi bacterium]|nr:hypothetical protein [Chloroflexota bacterium]
MKKKTNLIIILASILALSILSACDYYVVPTVSEEELAMHVAGTRSALSTQSSVETLVFKYEELINQPTSPACPTCPPPATPTPTEAPTQETEENPSTVIITPIGDQNDPRCLMFDFLGDVNNPPDTRMKPGETFTKTWWVRNSGVCTWTLQFDLVNSAGELFGSSGKVDFSQTVEPGETVQLSVRDLKAPSELGTYYSYWLIASPYGSRFGYGPNQQWGLGIKIIVAYE